MKKIISLIIIAIIATPALAQDNSAYEKKEYISGKDTLRYRILYPKNYDAKKKYPLVLFLHGSGERGNDNEAQLIHGSKLWLDEANRSKYPAIVIFPQCPRNDGWGRIRRDATRKDSLNGFVFDSGQPIGRSLEMVGQLLDSFKNSGKVNAKKIYVGGLSMGGFGTFEILWRKPNYFAAAFPICGGGDPGKIGQYGKKFPIWVFHGDKDPAVPVSCSRLMVGALKAAKDKVKYTEYPGVGHDSWNNAFAEPELLNWLFAQKK
jgi:predicted peptidase